MPNIYTKGIDPKISPICEKLYNLGTNYIIKVDEPQLQIYEFTDRPTEQVIQILKSEAAPRGVAVRYDDKTKQLSIKLHRLSESGRQEYKVNELPSSDADTIENLAIQYLGEKLRGPFSDLFRGMSLPVKIADVESVWQNNSEDPRWDELGDEKSAYVDKPGDFPPIVVDTVEESNGRLVDGYKRLFAAFQKKEQLIEYIDINDIILEAQKYLVEDQYKSPTRKMIEKQTAFRSSFGPSKSFGGIGGSKPKRKHSIKEGNQETYGKLSGDLVAHNRSTVIPSGSAIRIVDHDPALPDVEWEGQIINVDREALDKVFEISMFSEQLESALDNNDTQESEMIAESEFEQQLNETFGAVSIVNPDILLSINQTLDGKVVTTPKSDKDRENSNVNDN